MNAENEWNGTNRHIYIWLFAFDEATQGLILHDQERIGMEMNIGHKIEWFSDWFQNRLARCVCDSEQKMWRFM
jgi:hypothetical protein